MPERWECLCRFMREVAQLLRRVEKKHKGAEAYSMVKKLEALVEEAAAKVDEHEGRNMGRVVWVSVTASESVRYFLLFHFPKIIV